MKSHALEFILKYIIILLSRASHRSVFFIGGIYEKTCFTRRLCRSFSTSCDKSCICNAYYGRFYQLVMQFWGVVCLPFLIIGIKKLSSIRLKDKRVLIILAMSGAFAFTLSALKIPSVTGSSSHPTGMGLVAILLDLLQLVLLELLFYFSKRFYLHMVD